MPRNSRFSAPVRTRWCKFVATGSIETEIYCLVHIVIQDSFNFFKKQKGITKSRCEESLVQQLLCSEPSV